MKDKRLELKLSVRGDGSLSRNSARSSTRSNRSNLSNSSSALPVSEIFATDRYQAPNRAFDILDKYRQQSIQNEYPAQSLQNLHHQPQHRYGYRNGNFLPDYVEYIDPRYAPTEYPVRGGYQPVYRDPPAGVYSTVPRIPVYTQQNIINPVHYTLPRTARRVRISEHEPVVFGYGMFV